MQITEVLKSGAEDFKGWLILAEIYCLIIVKSQKIN